VPEGIEKSGQAGASFGELFLDRKFRTGLVVIAERLVELQQPLSDIVIVGARIDGLCSPRREPEVS